MAQNDFVPFATLSTANVEDQADWVADPIVGNGFFGGYAQSKQANKAIRQPSFVGACLSEWINEQLLTVPILDDGNVAEYVANLDAALTDKINKVVGRVRLTNNLNVYVDGTQPPGDGSSPSTPFPDIQSGINYILNNVELGPHLVTLNVAGGQTYGGGLQVGNSPVGLINSGYWLWNTYNGVAAINGSGLCLGVTGGAQFTLNGNFLFSCSPAAGNPNGCIVGLGGARIGINGGGLTFGNSPGCSHWIIQLGASIQNGNGTGTETIAGGGICHWQASAGGGIVMIDTQITIEGTPNFTYFAQALANGSISCQGLNFAGTGATGQRYDAETNGVIYTGGAGASYLPGSLPGGQSSGGQYV